jgi:hypothetical protein
MVGVGLKQQAFLMAELDRLLHDCLLRGRRFEKFDVTTHWSNGGLPQA